MTESILLFFRAPRVPNRRWMRQILAKYGHKPGDIRLLAPRLTPFTVTYACAAGLMGNKGALYCIAARESLHGLAAVEEVLWQATIKRTAA